MTGFEEKPVVNVGSNEKPVYFPQEVCRILPGQVYNGELATVQRQNMIKFSCCHPPRNYESITQDGLRIMGIENDQTVDSGIRVEKDMVIVPTRILSAPNLKYGTAKQTPRFGSWNLVGKRFCQGAPAPKKWTAILLRNRQPPHADAERSQATRVSQALRSLYEQIATLGLQWPPPDDHVNIDIIGDKWRSGIDSMFKGAVSRGYKFLVVILPTQEEQVFNHIKWAGDCKYGVLTHCCIAEKFLQGNPQYLANNVMKINLKMGGICQALEMPQSSRLINAGKTMLVGLDVTHPSPTDPENFPSIACIVASIDGRLGQWPGEVRMQRRRQESVQFLQLMMEGRLDRWKAVNRQLPQNIIMYRDGVSDGQFPTVLKDELQQIRDACQKKYPGSQPNITIIIVSKRHHVRFYPTKEGDADRTSNPVNGMVVDRGITRHGLWDFYLQAQAPLQGSARPAHYVVLHDEIFTNRNANPDGKPSDTLQELSHNICYIMGRCTRSISFSTPAFLADKFCDRARKYVRAYYAQLFDARGYNPNPPPPEPEITDLAADVSESMVYI